MAGPKFTTLTIVSKIFVFLITTDVVVSDSLPSCTDECAPFIPGAVAYWPMTFKTNGSDLSGNNNHAKCVGLTYTDGPNGEPQGAVHFNGSSNSFASVVNSPSMDIGKYPGFSFCGYVKYLGFANKSASLIDWTGIDGYGVFIVANSEQIIQLHLYPITSEVSKHIAQFANNMLINSAWLFIGISYDKATGRATLFKDGQVEVKQIDNNIAAGSDKTREVGLGIDLTGMEFNYHGDMSCMMLFKFALTTNEFKNVMELCRTTNSIQTMLPKIAMSDISTTNATASWIKSPGIFSGYSITIERRQGELGQEIVDPKFISSSTTILQSVLTNLVSGATYRVHVWHMQGNIRGRARSSNWFHTNPSLVVDSDSIIFSNMTATSATVSWNDVTGYYISFTVEISPTMGGAMADPSTVPRGSTTTSLKNLSPRTYYTISITTKSDLQTILPSTKAFHTPEPSLVVEPDSIIVSEITATSANISWKEVSGKFDAYSVDTSLSQGIKGAEADPSTVPRGTTAMSLHNLSPGSLYIITIRTKIGSRMSSPSMKSFQTLGISKADPPTSLSTTVIILIVAVIAVGVVGSVCIIYLRRKLNHDKDVAHRLGVLTNLMTDSGTREGNPNLNGVSKC